MSKPAVIAADRPATGKSRARPRSDPTLLVQLAAMAASNALTTSQSERLMDSCKTSPSVSRGTPLTRATSSAET